MKSYCFWLVFLSALTGVGGDVGAFKLDLQGPSQLLSPSFDSAIVTRVRVYRTGPRIWIDKLDGPLSLWNLTRTLADYSTTNRAEISALVSVLREYDRKGGLTNAPTLRGYTYHLLLIQDASETLMHFRVFEPIDSDPVWCLIYPRSFSGSSYDNKRIRSWLHERVKAAAINSTPVGEGRKNTGGNAKANTTSDTNAIPRQKVK